MKIAFVVDCEGLKFLEQGHLIYEGFDRLKFDINKLISPFRYNKNGFKLLYDFCVQNKVPVTFQLLGEKYAPIEGSPDNIEWGYHTLSHKTLPNLTMKELKKEVRNIYKVKSFTAPQWKYNSLDVMSQLLAAGYKYITYRGVSADMLQCGHVEEVAGIKRVYVSATFKGSLNDAAYIVRDMLYQFYREDDVYCISAHDFTFKDMKGLAMLYDSLSKYKWVRLSEL